MTLFTVQVAGASTAVEIYGGMTALDDYIISSGGDAYLELEAGGDGRKELAIKATRYIERKRWKGTANASGGTTLKFPRDGLKQEDGETAADNAYQLARVVQAVAELMMLGAEDESIFSEADQGSSIKRMKAGPAELELFSPTSTRTGTASVLPTTVNDLIGMWLAGGSGPIVGATAGGTSTGACGHSIFGRCGGYGRGEPF